MGGARCGERSGQSDLQRSLTALSELLLHVLGDVHPEMEHAILQEFAQVHDDAPAVVVVETGRLHFGHPDDVHEVLVAGVLQHVLGAFGQVCFVDTSVENAHLKRGGLVVRKVPSELVRHALADRDADVVQELLELALGRLAEVVDSAQVAKSRLRQLVDVLVLAVLQAIAEALAGLQAVDTPLEGRVPGLLEGYGRLIFGCGRGCSKEELSQGVRGARVAGDVVEFEIATDDVFRVLQKDTDRGIIEIDVPERLCVAVLEDEGQSLHCEHVSSSRLCQGRGMRRVNLPRLLRICQIKEALSGFFLFVISSVVEPDYRTGRRSLHSLRHYTGGGSVEMTVTKETIALCT